MMNIIKDRLTSLRRLMERDEIDYYLITSDDYHASEYVHDYFKSRCYMSGFTGSAGTLVIGRSWAGLWTDGRYFIQAASQLEGTGIELFKSGMPGVPSIREHLASVMSEGQTLAYDGRTVSRSFGTSLASSLEGMNIRILNSTDLVDEIWENRPAFSSEPIYLLTGKQAGASRKDKLRQLRDSLDCPLLIASLDDIAWLYNYRGNDVLYTPVAMAYTVVSKDMAALYISQDAVSADARTALEDDGIILKPYLQIYDDVSRQFGSDDSPCLQMDMDTVNEALTSLAAHPVFKANPVLMFKACKNPVEIDRIRNAHLKDGAAFTRTICRLKNLAASGEQTFITELDVSDMILSDRMDQDGFISLSFESIAASAEHGAIIHYAPTEETNIHLSRSFLLMDTGAHYWDGTTDVTRTIAMGPLTEYEKECYTAVLRGNLNLGAAVFPEGTSGQQLDCLARKQLWEMGLDYNHGTGHGVGYILSVHEGPNRISKTGSSTPLKPGMITSNEPGVYIENKFGIRLENLILCRRREHAPGFLDFETLTLVPFDRDAILPERMTREELDILNDYHARVYDCISPYLNESERTWLETATAPISKE